MGWKLAAVLVLIFICVVAAAWLWQPAAAVIVGGLEAAAWDEVGRDYFAVRRSALTALGLAEGPPAEIDWAALHRELAPLCGEREWGGNVDLEETAPGKFKPVVIHKEQSRLKQDPATGSATLGVALTRKIYRRPSVFTFHTHPANVDCGGAIPSTSDFGACILHCTDGGPVGDIVVSPHGLVVYGPRLEMLARVWKYPDPYYAQLLEVLAAQSALTKLGLARFTFDELAAAVNPLGLYVAKVHGDACTAEELIAPTPVDWLPGLARHIAKHAAHANKRLGELRDPAALDAFYKEAARRLTVLTTFDWL